VLHVNVVVIRGLVARQRKRKHKSFLRARSTFTTLFAKKKRKETLKNTDITLFEFLIKQYKVVAHTFAGTARDLSPNVP
jgi:hypothetical protein